MNNNVARGKTQIMQWSSGTQMQTPMGPSWDGDGTIYAADNAANKIFAFAVGETGSCREEGTNKVCEAPPLEEVCDFTAAFGISVVSGWDAGLEVVEIRGPDTGVHSTIEDVIGE